MKLVGGVGDFWISVRMMGFGVEKVSIVFCFFYLGYDWSLVVFFVDE